MMDDWRILAISALAGLFAAGAFWLVLAVIDVARARNAGRRHAHKLANDQEALLGQASDKK